MVKTFLKEGIYTQEEWNNEIMPLVDGGILKNRSKLLPRGFLVVFQVFDGLLEDTNKQFYRCVGWHAPSGVYIEVKKWSK